jgi:hypothetical protein
MMQTDIHRYSIVTVNENGKDRIDGNVEPAAPPNFLSGSCRAVRLLETRFYSAKITTPEKIREKQKSSGWERGPVSGAAPPSNG